MRRKDARRGGSGGGGGDKGGVGLGNSVDAGAVLFFLVEVVVIDFDRSILSAWAASGPETRTTATPLFPPPEESAKIVSEQAEELNEDEWKE